MISAGWRVTVKRTTELLVGLVLTLFAMAQAQVSAQTRAGEGMAMSQSLMGTIDLKQLPELIKLYALDAVLLPPDGQRIEGREAIEKYWRGFLETRVPVLTLKAMSARSSGDMAYESGSVAFSGSAANTGNAAIAGGNSIGLTRRIGGSYLIVRQRQSDGRWLIVQHAFTENFLGSLVEDKQPKARPDVSKPQEQ